MKNIVTFDKWENNKDVGEEIEVENWDRVKELISKIDGKIYTSVSIGDEKTGMVITGTGDGQYISYVTKNGKFYNLLNPNNLENNEEVKLIITRQLGKFKVKYIQDITNVLQATKFFLDNRDIDPTMKWEVV